MGRVDFKGFIKRWISELHGDTVLIIILWVDLAIYKNMFNSWNGGKDLLDYCNGYEHQT
jgi:hypothetical protein